MVRFRPTAVVVLLFAVALLVGAVGLGQPHATAAVPPQDKGQLMLTIFLKHDQSKTLGDIQKQLQQTGFAQKFPPAGVEVVSWYVMMGIGQVVTLRLPASRLREVNRIFETTAWGSYRTEFYATYDYKATGIAAHDKAQ